MSIQGKAYDRTGSDTGVPFAHVFAPFSDRSEAVIAGAQAVSRFFGRVVHAIAFRLREQGTIKALSVLDDRTLHDIGISRSEIRYVARQTALKYDRFWAGR